MKQKNQNPAATKDDLKTVAGSLKKDMQILRKDMQTLEGSLRAEIKFTANEILTKVDENARGYRDQILTSNDKLAKRLETMQEELGLGNLQMKRQVDNHEERIFRLEKIPQTV